jgi:hypothetical protein
MLYLSLLIRLTISTPMDASMEGYWSMNLGQSMYINPSTIIAYFA